MHTHTCSSTPTLIHPRLSTHTHLSTPTHILALKLLDNERERKVWNLKIDKNSYLRKQDLNFNYRTALLGHNIARSHHCKVTPLQSHSTADHSTAIAQPCLITIVLYVPRNLADSSEKHLPYSVHTGTIWIFQRHICPLAPQWCTPEMDTRMISTLKAEDTVHSPKSIIPVLPHSISTMSPQAVSRPNTIFPP